MPGVPWRVSNKVIECTTTLYLGGYASAGKGREKSSG